MDPIIELMIHMNDASVIKEVEGLSDDELKIFDLGRCAGLVDAMYIATMYMDRKDLNEIDQPGESIVDVMEEIVERMELVSSGGVKGIK